MARKFFVGGYWKYTRTILEVEKILSPLDAGEIPEVVISLPAVFQPFVICSSGPHYLMPAANWMKKGGAYTGEIRDENITWIIHGHSGRRSLLGESSELVGDEVAHALSQGFKVIACIGETLEQREAGSTMDVVAAQTKAIAERITDWTNVVLAYNPVWALETGEVVTPAQAQEVHYELRKWLQENVSLEVSSSTRIIYGGSVSGGNCNELAAQPDVDGFLVVGASMEPEFIDIIKSAELKKRCPVCGVEGKCFSFSKHLLREMR